MILVHFIGGPHVYVNAIRLQIMALANRLYRIAKINSEIRMDGISGW